MSTISLEYLDCDPYYLERIYDLPEAQKLSKNVCKLYCVLKENAPEDYDYEDCFQTIVDFMRNHFRDKREDVNIDTAFIVLFFSILSIMTAIGFFLLFSKRL